MIVILRSSVITKWIWGFLVLVLLNISVDVPDSNPNYCAEDLSYNDQESIIELVLEKLLGFENAIMEMEDQDSEEQNKQSGSKVDFALLHTFVEDYHQPNFTFKQQVIDRFNYLLAKGHVKIMAPPPKS